MPAQVQDERPKTIAHPGAKERKVKTVSGVACYIRRSHSGQAIAGLRMVALGLDLAWNAPDPDAAAGAPPSGEGGAARANTGPLHSARQAASWIVENLRALNTRTLDCLCIDPQGAVCSWLAAPSPDAKVIRATITQAALSGVDNDSGSAARLAFLPASDPATATSELSVQALAVDDDADHPGDTSRGGRPTGAPSAPGARAGRFPLVSIPDAVVRVLLDELDERGIEVGQILSLWHAMAATLDPGVRNDPASRVNDLADTGLGQRVVAGSGVASALLLIDPLGSLQWAWALDGQLLVGGSMRLKQVAIRSAAPESPPPFAGDPAPAELLPDDTARRIGAPDPAPGAAGASSESANYQDRLECSAIDVGRLVLDWLSWSAQLGRAPERVISIGPATVASASADAARDPRAGLGEAIARAWGSAGGAPDGPLSRSRAGATIDLIEEDDPIGLVLARLAGVSTGLAALAPAAGEYPDPRRALVELSVRPTRATRRMYQWGALAIVALAVAFVAAGYQLHASARGAADIVAQAKSRQTEALQSISGIVPNLHLSSQPEKDLGEKLKELRRRAALVKPLTPVIPEVNRVLAAFASVRDKLPENAQSELKIVEISFSPVAPGIRLQVPDAATGPEIEVALQANPGSVRWTGRAPPSAGGGPRQYVLSGQYLEVTPASPAPPTAPAPATPAPGQGAKP